MIWNNNFSPSSAELEWEESLKNSLWTQNPILFEILIDMFCLNLVGWQWRSEGRWSSNCYCKSQKHFTYQAFLLNDYKSAIFFSLTFNNFFLHRQLSKYFENFLDFLSSSNLINPTGSQRECSSWWKHV